MIWKEYSGNIVADLVIKALQEGIRSYSSLNMASRAKKVKESSLFHLAKL